MKLICIITQFAELTYGKIYEIRHKYDMFYNYDEVLEISIINDEGIRKNYPLSLFLELSDYREQKLKQLGI